MSARRNGLGVLLFGLADADANVLATALAEHGHDVVRSDDAGAAWDRYRERLFPLVVLAGDLLHGPNARLLAGIRQHPDSDGTWVVWVADRGSPDETAAAIGAGADDFLVAPFHPVVLAARLDVIVRRVKELLAEKRTRQDIEDAHSELDRRVHERPPRAMGILEEEIAGRRRAELASFRFETALESAGEAVVITDPAGTIEYVNHAFESLTGYSRDEVLGKNPRILKSGRHEAPFYRSLWTTVAAGSIWHREFTNRRKDGSLYDVEQTIAPIRGPEGRAVGFVGIQRDISERKHAEWRLRELNAELARARDEVIAASHIKSSFLARMSHELRTPLNAILGYEELIKERAEDEGYGSLVPDLEKIRSAGKHLLLLVEDLLDISKLETGRMDLLVSTFPLAPLLHDELELARPACARNGNRLETGDLPEISVVADERRVRQVVRNLLSNAARFTSDGSVRLTVSNGGSFVDVEVRDTGIGIAPPQLERLFQPFMQVDESPTRRYGGSGLGLAISKRLCELMGGGLSVSSRLGEGSTFAIRLPRSPATPGPLAGP